MLFNPFTHMFLVLFEGSLKQKGYSIWGAAPPRPPTLRDSILCHLAPPNRTTSSATATHCYKRTYNNITVPCKKLKQSL